MSLTLLNPETVHVTFRETAAVVAGIHPEDYSPSQLDEIEAGFRDVLAKVAPAIHPTSAFALRSQP
jgi:hypothetical protein